MDNRNYFLARESFLGVCILAVFFVLIWPIARFGYVEYDCKKLILLLNSLSLPSSPFLRVC